MFESDNHQYHFVGVYTTSLGETIASRISQVVLDEPCHYLAIVILPNKGMYGESIAYQSIRKAQRHLEDVSGWGKGIAKSQAVSMT